MEIIWIIISSLIFLIYFYYKKCYQYWEKKGVPTIQPKIPFGNLGNPLKLTIEKFVNIHQTFKRMGAKYGGIYIFTKPILMVIDPEIVKTVVSKDYQNFNSHGNAFLDEEDPLLKHFLFNLEGNKWRALRAKLSPCFSSGKIKMVFQTMINCGEQMKKFVFQYDNKKGLDIHKAFSSYTIDFIGSCVFGLECNSFTNPDAEFLKYGQKIFEPSLKFNLRRILPTKISKIFQIRLINQDITDFFIKVVNDIIDFRKSDNTPRNDFLQILLNLQEKIGMTIEEIAAQTYSFFIAGFETTSTTATFCLYELVHHQDIQDKLRDEIRGIIERNDGKITYDGINEMEYLDQVINETLRKYPPLHTLPRKCIETCILNGVVIEKNTDVMVNVLAIHRDEEYYPNPDQFDPDRFSHKNKHNIIPYTFLPFGEGPRICIGLKIGLLQIKVALCLLLRNFKFFPHSSLKYPIEFEDNANSVLSGKDPIMLTIQKI